MTRNMVYFNHRKDKTKNMEEIKMATLILILRVLVIILDAVFFTAILMMSKEFWGDDKLVFVVVILADMVGACLTIFFILI